MLLDGFADCRGGGEAVKGIFVLAAMAVLSGAARAGVLREEWTDAGRKRNVPVKIYYPHDDSGGKPPWPVIIFSHGLGGSRETYGYLGAYWAAHGYVSVHLQHPGSDETVIKDSAEPWRDLRRAAMKPESIVNRPLDGKFAIDRLKALNDDPAFPLHGKLDLSRIGVAGHSFGAYVTMALAGQSFMNGRDVAPFKDNRIKAGLALSTPVAGTGRDKDILYAPIRIPIFHMTGTTDDSPIGETTAAQRRLPFDHTKNAPAYLVTLADGDHMIFAGRRIGPEQPNDAAVQALICKSSTAFWDAWLKGDAKAKEWLEGGAFAAELGKLGQFEQSKPEQIP